LPINGELYEDESGFTQRKTKVHGIVQNGQLLGHTLSQINPIHIVTHYLRSV